MSPYLASAEYFSPQACCPMVWNGASTWGPVAHRACAVAHCVVVCLGFWQAFAGTRLRGPADSASMAYHPGHAPDSNATLDAGRPALVSPDRRRDAVAVASSVSSVSLAAAVAAAAAVATSATATAAGIAEGKHSAGRQQRTRLPAKGRLDVGMQPPAPSAADPGPDAVVAVRSLGKPFRKRSSAGKPGGVANAGIFSSDGLVSGDGSGDGDGGGGWGVGEAAPAAAPEATNVRKARRRGDSRAVDAASRTAGDAIVDGEAEAVTVASQARSRKHARAGDEARPEAEGGAEDVAPATPGNRHLMSAAKRQRQAALEAEEEGEEEGPGRLAGPVAEKPVCATRGCGGVPNGRCPGRMCTVCCRATGKPCYQHRRGVLASSKPSTSDPTLSPISHGSKSRRAHGVVAAPGAASLPCPPPAAAAADDDAGGADAAPVKKVSTNFRCFSGSGCDGMGNSHCPQKFCVDCCIGTGSVCKAHARSTKAREVLAGRAGEQRFGACCSCGDGGHPAHCFL